MDPEIFESLLGAERAAHVSVNESRHTRMSHVTYELVTSHMDPEIFEALLCAERAAHMSVNESRHTWMSHVTHECVTFHMNASRHTWMRHVVYESRDFCNWLERHAQRRQAPMNESRHTWLSYPHMEESPYSWILENLGIRVWRDSHPFVMWLIYRRYLVLSVLLMQTCGSFTCVIWLSCMCVWHDFLMCAACSFLVFDTTDQMWNVAHFNLYAWLMCMWNMRLLWLT